MTFSEVKLEVVRWVTCDGEDCRGVAKRHKLVFATTMIDDNLHVVGAKRDVVCTDGERGGWSIGHLPVTSLNTPAMK